MCHLQGPAGERDCLSNSRAAAFAAANGRRKGVGRWRQSCKQLIALGKRSALLLAEAFGYSPPNRR